MLWAKDEVTGSGADSTDTSHPFIVSLLLLFSCVFFPLMIYRLQEHNTGSDERQRDIKKRKRERKGGRKEGAEGADHSL